MDSQPLPPSFCCPQHGEKKQNAHLADMMVVVFVVPKAAPKSRQGGTKKNFVMHAFVGAHPGKRLRSRSCLRGSHLGNVAT